MKHVNVPAQITTVEDKIAGNLTMHQLLLLVLPIPINIVVYAVVPSFLAINIYKLIIIILITVTFCILSIKINGKILLDWLNIVIKYNQRPMFYVFNKNNQYLRPTTYHSNLETKDESLSQKEPKKTLKLDKNNDKDLLKARHILHSPKASLSFSLSKEGSLNVYIAKINQ